MTPSLIKSMGVLLILLVLSVNEEAASFDIAGPHIVMEENNLRVSFRFELDPDIVREIENGISKEIIFYVDLFRSWKIWPDEFIAGRKIVRTLKSDPMKKEFTIQSFEGKTMIVKRFNSFQSMMEWALSFDNMLLATMQNMETGNYFVKVTAEAHYRRIPSLISEIFFFLPARDFKVTADSKILKWNKHAGEVSR